MRLGEALASFQLQLEADGRSPHTRDQYGRHIRLLARWLAKEGHGDELDDVDHQTLARFLCSSDGRTSRNGRQKLATSVNALRTSLRCFFAFCEMAGWCEQSPARFIRRARCAGPPPRGLSDHDRQRLLDTLGAAKGPVARRDHLLLDLMLATGVRLSAALALTADDVDLERGEVVVRHAKGDRVETVVLGRAIQSHLGSYLAGRPPGPLFPGQDGKPISRRHAARRLSNWTKRAGCRGSAHPHTLRHSFAQGLYRQTTDLLLVQAALGHRSILSTLVYAKIDQDRLRQVLVS